MLTVIYFPNEQNNTGPNYTPKYISENIIDIPSSAASKIFLAKLNNNSKYERNEQTLQERFIRFCVWISKFKI